MEKTSCDFLFLDWSRDFFREKLIRLEHQNKVLTLQLQEAENEKTHILEANLDIANEKVNRLQTENRHEKYVFMNILFITQ